MLGDEAVAFLNALAANNDRAWFRKNRATYEADLNTPAKRFSEALALELERETGIAHRPRIYRINRDLRFSKDKTPYNTHLHISLTPEAGGPAWMFGLERERLVLGVGIFAFAGRALDRWRKRVDGPDGEALAAQLDRLLASGARIEEPELKRVPSPYPADHPRASLLRRKGLAVWLDLADYAAAFGERGAVHCAGQLMRLRAVFDWLRENNG